MAVSVDEYYKKLYETGKSTLEEQENLIAKQAQEQIQAQTDSYNKQMAEIKTGYEDALRRNETQRLLNERYLERKAAEMGLTDSGMNRTQMTANQLSHANQQGRLEDSMQKDINTLAAAMRAKIGEIETSRDSSIAQIKSDYDTSVRSQAVDLYNADIKTKQDEVAKAADALDSLASRLNDDELSEATKNSFIQTYVNRYGSSEAFYDVIKNFGYDNDSAYNNVLKYFVQSNISKEEKIKKFLETYKIYGPPNNNFLSAVENAPLQYIGGITLQSLERAIRGTFGG